MDAAGSAVLVQRPAGRSASTPCCSLGFRQDGHLQRLQGGPQSGCRWRNRPKPMTVKFTKTGTFRYYCDIHPGMNGTSRSSPEQRGPEREGRTRRRVKHQVARPGDRQDAGPHVAPPATPSMSARRAGRRRASSASSRPTVRPAPGTTVTFRMTPSRSRSTRRRRAPATPRPSRRPTSGQIEAGSRRPVFDPRGVYPSEPPGRARSADADVPRQRVLEQRRLDHSTRPPPFRRPTR